MSKKAVQQIMLGTVTKNEAQARKFGTDKVVITGMYRFDYSDPAAVKALVKDLNQSGEILKKAGIRGHGPLGGVQAAR